MVSNLLILVSKIAIDADACLL